MISFLLAVVCGVLVCCVTGTTPGLHMNLVASLIVALHIPGTLPVLVFLVSLSVAHTFLDGVPAVFLGVPDADTVVAMMPAHKLLLEGRGFDAVALLTFGSFLGLLCALLLSPLFFFASPFLYELIRSHTFWILLCIVLFLIWRDSFPFRALLLFCVSGVLGLYVLRYSDVSEPLLPLLSGLFGVSTLLSGVGVSNIPAQFSTRLMIPFLPSLKGCLLGCCSGFLPGIGSSQSASFARSKSGEEFLLIVGALNTASIVFTIIIASSLGRARSGTAEALLSMVHVDSFLLPVLLLAVLLSGCLSLFACLLIAKFCALNMHRFRPSFISFFILILVVVLVLYVSGIQGFAVLLLSSRVGILSLLLGCGRAHAMACIIVPVMFYVW